MDTASWLALLLGVSQLGMGLILFLVGRLLTANKEAIDTLNRSLRDIASVIETLRAKLQVVEIAVARLEVAGQIAPDHAKPPLKEVAAGGE